MFGTTSLTENPIYNFMSEENALKWKGQFLHALQEVSANNLFEVRSKSTCCNTKSKEEYSDLLTTYS